ncbi:MAG: hypothetical protein D6782_02000, partial [Alphaproteobacteria bacterium]
MDARRTAAPASGRLARGGVFSPAPAQVVQTHQSLVFLTADRAYKLKKPVLPARAASDVLAARRRAAEEEVALNRRLAASVYRGVVPLYRRADGSYGLTGPGVVADWAIEMRRLDERLMLARMIAEGRAGAGDLARVGDRLAAFYAALPPQGRRPAA